MADSVDLTVRLVDDASRQARKIAAALGQTEAAAKSLGKATSRGKGLLGADMLKSLRRHAQLNDPTLGRRPKPPRPPKPPRQPKMPHGMKGGHGGGGIGGVLEMATGMATGMAIGAVLMGVVNLATAVARLSAEFTGAVFGAAMFRETATGAFKALSKGASDGSKEFEKVRDLAFQFGVPLEDAMEQFTSLRRMGFAMPDVERLFKRFQDLRAIGVTGDQINRAVVAITQIKATGKLQGDELMQLAEAGVSIDEVYKSLGKRLKKTVPEIIKLKEAGKITATDSIAAIEDAMSTMAGGKAPGTLGKDFANNTISGMFQRLKNAGGVLLDEIAKRITPAFKALQPIFSDLFAFLQSADGKSLFDTIGATFTAVFGAMRAAWPFVKEFLSSFRKGFGKGMDAAMKTLAPALDALKKAFGKDSAAHLKTLGQLAYVVGFALGFMLTQLLQLAAGFALLATHVSKMIDRIRTVVDGLNKFTSGFRGIGNSFGTNLVDGFIGGIMGGLGRAASAARALMSSATNGLSTSIGLGSTGIGTGLGGGIPTGSFGIGKLLGANAGGMSAGASNTTTYAPQTSISVTGVESKDLASKIRSEVERALLQKFGGASPA